jgi:hypothetical protein
MQLTLKEIRLVVAAAIKGCPHSGHAILGSIACNASAEDWQAVQRQLHHADAYGSLWLVRSRLS